MRKKTFVLLRVQILAAVAIFCGGLAWAAGEWEWTEGEGWTMGAGVARPTAREQLAYAYQVEQRSEFMDAARQYFLLIRNFPDTQEAGVGLQRLAKCLFEMENYYTSYRAIEQVIKTYPKTGRMSDLVEIELRIAKKMVMSKSDAILDSEGDGARGTNVRHSLEVVQAVLDHDPYGVSAPEAYLVRGEAYLMLSEIPQARDAFNAILEEFPKSDFVERARLGVIRCDSLLGYAKPQEVQEQIQVVRETEAARVEERGEPEDEFDSVEESFRQVEETEAGKMMEQAEVYRNMGFPNAVRSAEFLYKEVVRRYPATSHAEDARARLGNIKIPKVSRTAEWRKNLTLNPFSWGKEKDPPWIIPQLPPEAVVLDQGIGPIAGVPETEGAPAGSGVGLRPVAMEAAAPPSGEIAGFGDARSAGDGALPPPEALAPLPPAAYDNRVYTSDPSAQFAAVPAPPAMQAPDPGLVDLGPGRSTVASAAMANPLPAISESDLVATSPRSVPAAPPPAFAPPPAPSPVPAYSAPPAYPEPQPETALVQAPSFPPDGAPMPEIEPSAPFHASAPASAAVLPMPENSMDDLVGPVRREIPSAGAPGAYQPQAGYPQYPQALANPYPQPVVSQGGGWTLGPEFR